MTDCLHKIRDNSSGFMPEITDEVGYGVGQEENSDPPIPTLVPLQIITVKARDVIGEHGRRETIEDNIVVDNPACYAKLTKGESKRLKFFVKATANGVLFDPWGPNTDLSNKRYLAQMGRNLYEFKRVNEESFVNYTKYLMFRNPANFRNAQRESDMGVIR